MDAGSLTGAFLFCTGDTEEDPGLNVNPKQESTHTSSARARGHRFSRSLDGHISRLLHEEQESFVAYVVADEEEEDDVDSDRDGVYSDDPGA